MCDDFGKRITFLHYNHYTNPIDHRRCLGLINKFFKVTDKVVDVPLYTGH